MIIRSVFLFLALQLPAHASSLPTVLDRIADQIIKPAHHQFVITTEQLERDLTSFCDQPTTAGLQRAKNDWYEAMEAWQAVNAYQFGPLLEHNVSWKVQFWPDTHNLIRKKAEAFIASDAPTTPAQLDQESVVIQGLSALEYLLFDEQSHLTIEHTPQQQRRCSTAAAMAAHTTDVANTLHGAWSNDKSGYLGQWKKPQPGHPEVSSREAELGLIVATLVQASDNDKGKKLGLPLGKTSKGDRVRPYLAEAWRSDHSIALLAASNAHQLALFTALSPYIRGEGHGVLADAIQHQYLDIKKAIKQLQTIPLNQALQDKTALLALNQLYQQLGQLEGQIKHELVDALDINLGFNRNDGD